jgi:hypothetical protein
MGGVGYADPDQVFYEQPFCAVKPEIPSKDALGQDKSGGFLQVFASEK